MRFADLLGDPDDGSAPGASTTEGPGVPASGSGTAPAGASGSFGSFGSAGPTDPDRPVGTDPAPGSTGAAAVRPSPATGVAATTGAYEARDDRITAATAADPPGSAPSRAPAAPLDDLLPARANPRQRRRR